MIELLQGNCMSFMAEVVKDNKVKNPIIVSDPPFNIGYHYNSYKDKMNENEYFEWLRDVFSFAPFVIIHYPESIYKLALKIGGDLRKSSPGYITLILENSIEI